MKAGFVTRKTIASVRHKSNRCFFWPLGVISYINWVSLDELVGVKGVELVLKASVASIAGVIEFSLMIKCKDILLRLNRVSKSVTVESTK